MSNTKEKAKSYTIAELDLTLSYDTKDKDRIHLTCHGYDKLEEHGHKLLEEVVGCLDVAIKLCTHKDATILKNPYRTTSRFDILSTHFDIGADALFAIADHTLGKISAATAQTKHPTAMVRRFRTVLRDGDHHERNSLATSLRGGIQSVFAQFHAIQKKAATEHTDSPVTRAGRTADNKLSDALRDKLIHVTLLDYYLGDEAIDGIVVEDRRTLGESVDTFVQRVADGADNAVKKRIDAFLQAENVAKRAPKIRHYLSGELASAVEKSIGDLQKEQRRQKTTQRQ